MGCIWSRLPEELGETCTPACAGLYELTYSVKEERFAVRNGLNKGGTYRVKWMSLGWWSPRCVTTQISRYCTRSRDTK